MRRNDRTFRPNGAKAPAPVWVWLLMLLVLFFSGGAAALFALA